MHGEWQPFSSGTTVGAKRIDLAARPVAATSLRFSVRSGFGVPTGLRPAPVPAFAFACVRLPRRLLESDQPRAPRRVAPRHA